MMRAAVFLLLVAVLGTATACTISVFPTSGNGFLAGDTFLATVPSSCTHDSAAINGMSVQLSAQSVNSVTRYFATVTTAGNFSLAVKQSGTDVSGSPVTFQVFPGSFSPADTVSTGTGLSTATSGVLQSFALTARDEYGNLLTSTGNRYTVAVSSNGHQASVSQSVDSAVTTVSYSTTLAGSYSIVVTSTSPVASVLQSTAVVSPAGLDMSSLKLASGSSFVATAGQTGTFSVSSRDEYGNSRSSEGPDLSPSFAVSSASTSGNLSAAANNDGTYTISLLATVTGDYSVTVSAAGLSGTSSFTGSLVNGEISASASTVQQWPSSVVAGSQAVATLQMVDKYGNIASGGSASWSTSVGGSACENSCSITYSNGVASLSVVLTVSGEYSLSVGASGDSVIGMPKSLTVFPEHSAPATAVNGTYSSDVIAGEQATASVQVMDKYGNARTGASEIAMTATASGPTALNGVVQDSQNGTVLISFSPTVSGTYTVSVFASSSSVASSASFVTIAAAPSASATIFEGGRDFGFAGLNRTLTVKLRDKWSNVVSTGDHSSSLSVALEGPQIGNGTVSHTVGDQYPAYVLVTRTGDYLVHVKLDGSNVVGSPVSVAVQGHNVVPSASSVLDTNADGKIVGVAGTSLKFAVQTQDKYGNRMVGVTGHWRDGEVSTNFLVAGPESRNITLTTREGAAVIQTQPITFTAAGHYSLSVSVTFNRDVFGHEENSFASLAVVPIVIQASNPVLAGIFLSGYGQSVATAGDRSYFSVETKDQFGNLRTNISSSADDNLLVRSEVYFQGSLMSPVPAVRGQEDGTYEMSYVHTRAGTYNLKVFFDSQYVPLLDRNITLHPGPSTGQTSLGYPAQFNGTAGAQSHMFVRSQDRFGNVRTDGGGQFSLNVSDPFNSPMTNNIVDLLDGTFRVEVTTTLAGQYTIDVQLDGNSISTAPHYVQYYPAAASASSSKVIPQSISTAGRTMFCSVQAVDQFGNDKTTGGDEFVMLAVSENGDESVQGTVVDLNNGQYVASVTLNSTKVFNISVKFDNQDIGNAPFQALILPGPICASKSTALGSGVSLGTAGTSTEFSVSLRDQFGNRVTNSSAPMSVTVSGASSVTGDSSYGGNGVMNGRWQVTRSGTFRVTVLLSGNPAQGSPFETVIIPNEICATSSFASGAALTTAVAGTQSTFSITSRDEFGNVLTSNAGNFAVQLTSQQQNVTGLTTYTDAGIHTGTFLATISGRFQVAVTLSSQPIADAISSMFLHPATRFGQASIMSGVNNGTAGSQSSFVVRLKDRYDNFLSKGGDSSGFSLARVVSGSYSLSATVSDNQDGSYSISYTATLAGAYIATLAVDSNSVIGSGAKFATYPSSPCASTSSSVGNGVSLATAGDSASFRVTARDQFYNRRWDGYSGFTATMTGPATNSLLVEDNADGSYNVTHTSTRAGTYSLSVTFANNLVGESSPQVSLVPSITDSARCFSTLGSGSIASAGISHQFSVTARDRFDNIKSQGGETFVASAVHGGSAVSDVSLGVTDSQNGRYDFSMILTITGQYSVSVTRNGESIQEASIAFSNLPGQPDISHSVAFGQALEVATAGQRAYLSVRVRDAYANNITVAQAGSLSFSTILGSGADALFVAPPQLADDGLFHTSYLTTVAANTRVSVLSGATGVSGSPFTVPVVPQSTAVSEVLTEGTATFIAQAGFDMPLNIYAKDKYGNMRTSGGDALSLNMAAIGSLVGKAGSFQDFNNGTYLATYTVTHAGNYQLNVLLGSSFVGRNSFRAPFLVRVDAGPLSPAHVQVIGDGWKVATANVDSSFWLRLNDKNFNFLGFGRVRDLAVGFETDSLVTVVKTFIAINFKNSDTGVEYEVMEKQNALIKRAADASGNALATVRLEDDGLVKVTYKMGITGTYRMTVLLSGGSVYNAPYTMRVHPLDNTPSPSLCEIGDGLIPAAGTTVEAGLRKRGSLTLRNQHGVQISSLDSSITLSAVLRGTSASNSGVTLAADIFQSGTSTRQLQYIATIAGTYSFAVQVGGVDVQGSPFQVDVRSSWTSRHGSIALLSQLRSFAAGTPQNFSILARDRFENNQNANDVEPMTFSFGTLATEASHSQSAMTRLQGAEYQGAIWAKEAGLYVVKAFFNGKLVAGTPHILQIVAAGLNISASTVSGSGLSTAVAGLQTSVSLVTKDIYGNAMDRAVSGITLVSASAAPGSFEADVVYVSGAEYDIVYTATVAGSYKFHVQHSGSVLADKAFQPSISPAPAVASRSTVVSSLPTSTVAGSIISIIVQAVDNFGNNHSVGGESMIFSTVGPAVLQGSLDSQGDGTYSGSFSPEIAGTYALSVRLGGSAVSGMPVSISVSPASSFAQAIQTIGSGVSSAVAGEQTEFIIVSRDRFGNRRTVGGDSIDVQASGASSFSGVIVDHNDGSWTASYSSVVAGEYSLAISINGAAIQSSPFTLNIAPEASTDAGKSLQYGGSFASRSSLVRRVSFLYVQSCDRFGNNRTIGGDDFSVDLLGPALLKADIRDQQDGTYLVMFNVPVEGTYRMSTSLNNVPLQGSPVSIVATIPGTGLERVSASGSGLSTAVAGDTVNYLIDGTDAKARQTMGNSIYTVAISNNVYYKSPSAVGSAGNFTASLLVTFAGTFSVDIRGVGKPIPNSPFRVQVIPGPISLVASTVSGGGRFGAIVGSDAQVLITARDQFGNARLDSGDPVGASWNGNALVLAYQSTGNYEGSFKGQYSAGSTGFYSLAVSIGGQALENSPFNTSVVASAGLPSALYSAVIGSAISKPIVAGSNIQFSVVVRDVNGVDTRITDFSNVQTVIKRVDPGATESVTPSLVTSASSAGNAVFSSVLNVAGQWQLTARVAGQIASAPLISVISNSAVASGSTLEGSGFIDGSAQSFASFIVQLRDRFGNKVISAEGAGAVTVSITRDNGVDVDVAVRDNADGTYISEYACTAAGKYSIAATLGGAALSNSGATRFVSPASPSMKESTLGGDALQGMTAGSSVAGGILVDLKDEFGNRHQSIPSQLDVRFDGAPLQLVVVAGGFTGDASTNVAGIKTVSARYAGSDLTGSPTPLTVNPSSFHPPTSSFSGDGLTLATAGLSASVILQAKDQFGNMLTSGGADVDITIAGSLGSISADLVDHGNGTYVVSYAPTVSGDYSLSAGYLGRLIGGVSYQLGVEPAAAHPLSSSVVSRFSPRLSLKDSQEVAMSVQVRDRFWNLRTVCTDAVNGTGVSTSHTQTVAYVSCSQGLHNIAFRTTVAASYSLSIVVNGGSVESAPFALEVVPAATCGSSSSASGAGLAGPATAGVAQRFTIQARDTYGNIALFNPFQVDKVQVSAYMEIKGDKACVPRTSSNSEAQVAAQNTILCPDISIVNNLDSTFSVAYTLYSTATLNGEYRLQVGINDLPVAGGPFTVAVSPSVSSAQMSTVSLNPASITAGEFALVALASKDNYGNDLPSGGLDVNMELILPADLDDGERNPTTVVLPANDNGDGSYSSGTFVTRAGLYRVAVTLGGSEAGTDSKYLTVKTGGIDGSACTMSGGGVLGGHSSFSSTFDIEARDQYGNMLSSGGESFAVTVTSGGGYSWLSSSNSQPLDRGDGTYSVTYTVDKKGLFTLSVLHVSSSQQIQGSPRSTVYFIDDTTTAANTPVGVRSVATGSGLSSVPAGAAGRGTLIMRNIDSINLWSGGMASRVSTSMQRQLTNENVEVSVSDNGDGTYMIDYIATYTGTYSLSVKIDGEDIFGSPFAVIVTPGTISLPSTGVSSEAILPSVAGQQRSFVVTPKDVYGNTRLLSKDVRRDAIAANWQLSGSSVSGSASIVSNDDGTSSVSFTPTVTGQYSISVSVAGQLAKNMQSVEVRPSLIAPGKTQVSGALIGSALAGATADLSITAQDQFENIITTGTDEFKASIFSGTTQIWTSTVSLVDGVFAAETTITRSGMYSVSIAVATSEGDVPVPGSPFTLNVLTGPTCTSTSSLHLPSGMTSATAEAGTVFVSSITAFDQFGNRVQSGNNFFKVTALASQAVAGVLGDNKDGTYSASLEISVSGKYNVSVIRNGLAVLNTPFELDVIPTVPMAEQSTFTMSSSSTAAGSAVTVVVSARDRFANVISVGGSAFRVLLSGASTQEILASDLGNGKYRAPVTPLTSGAHSIVVMLGRSRVEDKQVSLNVLPSILSHNMSGIMPLSARTVASGTYVSVQIALRDAFKNILASGAGPMSVTLASAGQNSVQVSATDLGNGKYSALLPATSAGSFEVSASLGNAALGTKQQLAVLTGGINAPSCILAGPSASLSAGSSAWLRWDANDANGNRLEAAGENFVASAVALNGDKRVLDRASVNVLDYTNGTYAASLAPSLAGEYLVFVTRFAVHVAGSPFSLSVVPGVADASMSSAFGRNIEEALLAEEAQYQVLLRDSFRNQIHAQSAHQAIASVVTTGEGMSTSFGNGVTTIKWTPTTIGTSTVYTKVSGVNLGSNGVASVAVVNSVTGSKASAGSITAAQSILAGQSMSLQVIRRDVSGQQLSTGTVSASFTSSESASTSSITLNDASGGIKTAQWTITKAGKYILQVTDGSGNHFGGSPHYFTVMPSAVNISKSVVTGDGLNSAVAGQTASFSLSLVDNFGNSFAVHMAGSGQLNYSIPNASPLLADNFDGSASILYTATQSGDLPISLKWAGAILTSRAISVSSGVMSPSKSVLASPQAGLVVLAGSSIQVVVESKDAFDNRNLDTAIAFTIRISGPRGSVSSTSLISPGFHGNNVTLRSAGSYSIAALAGAASVRSSPVEITVQPGAISASNSAAAGAGTVSAVAGAKSQVLVTLRDMFNNLITGSQTLSQISFSAKQCFKVSNGVKLPDTVSCSDQLELSVTTSVATVNGATIVAFYSAPMHGEVRLTISTETGSSQHIPNSPYTVSVARSKAPVASSAQFSDSAGRILVSFDIATNKAAMTGAQTCSSILTTATIATLGSGNSAQCMWIDDKRLQVLLGFGATVQANDRISFKSDAIFAARVCNALGCFQSSNAVSGKLSVSRPRNPPTPVPVLVAPVKVSTCDPLVMDVSQTQGSGGRPFANVLWGLYAGVENEDAVRADLIGQTDQTKATLSAGSLVAGQKYRFLVRIINFLDVAAEVNHEVEVVSSANPGVVVLGSKDRTVYASQNLRLKAAVSKSGCSSDSSQLALAWSVSTISPALPSGSNFSLDATTQTSSTLFIPKGALRAGHVYTLVFTATDPSTGLNSADTVVIRCAFAPLVARIAGGSRMVYSSDAVTIDGSQSLDLDTGDVASSIPFTYTWACTPQGAEGEECFQGASSLLLAGTSRISFPQSSLVPGQYDITLTVSKEPGPRISTASITLYVSPIDSLDVSITPISTRKVNADDRIVIDGSIAGLSDTDTVTYMWTQVAGESMLTNSNGQRNLARVSAPLDGSFLSLLPLALQPGQMYGFRLTCTDQTGKVGFSEISLEVNSPPSSGRFLVTPSSGIALSTKFFLQSLSWEDDPSDLPLSYEYKYSTGTCPEIPIIATDNNEYRSVLPDVSSSSGCTPTCTASSCSVNAIVLVKDNLGASSKSVKQITVNFPQGRRRLLASISQLEQDAQAAVDVGSCEDLLQAVSSLSTAPGVSICPWAKHMTVCTSRPPKASVNAALYTIRSLISAASGSCSDDEEELLMETMSSLSAAADSDDEVIDGLAADSMVSALSGILSSSTARALRTGVTPRTLTTRRSGRRNSGGVAGSTGKLHSALARGRRSGEDEASAVGNGIALASRKANARNLNSRKSSFSPGNGDGESSGGGIATPAGALNNVASGAGVTASATSYSSTPFASSSRVNSGVSSLSFSAGDEEVEVDDLEDPVEVEMPIANVRRVPGTGDVDTCSYWDHGRSKWSMRGCYSKGRRGNVARCNCFHLTDFGSVASEALPEMNVVDPIGDADLFTQIGADNMTTLIVVGSILLSYCLFMFLGWRADKKDLEKAAATPIPTGPVKRPGAGTIDLEEVLDSHDYMLLRRIMKGRIGQKLALIRQKFKTAVRQDHVFLSCIWRPHDSAYTRPRRITVLYCIIMGNMAINGMFVGGSNNNPAQRITGGIISAIILFPASFLFAYLFKNVAMDRRSAAMLAKERKAQQGDVQSVLMGDRTGNATESGVLAPPSQLMPSEAAPRPRGVLPEPGAAQFLRAGHAEPASLDNTAVNSAASGPQFRRRPAEPMDAVTSSDAVDAEVEEGSAGTFILRRALPRRGSPTDGEFTNVPPPMPPARPPLSHAVPGHESSHVVQKQERGAESTADAPRGELKVARGMMRSVYSGAEKALRFMTPKSGVSKKRQPLPSRMAILAYSMAWMFFLISAYFSILYGLKFSKAMESAWLAAFAIAIVQDMVVQQTVKVAARAGVVLVVVPQFASYMAGRILGKYRLESREEQEQQQ